VLRSPTLKVAGLAALFVAAALFGIAGGVMFAFMGDLPGLPSLENYSPSVTTRILGRDGVVVGELATQRREILKSSDIPDVLQKAVLSAEDSSFFQHQGIDIPRTIVRLVKDVVYRQMKGGSTISQQLARNVFPESIGFQQTPERKIKEALVTLQIEKRYTKSEIFTMYCNQINMGHGAYGMGAASQMYFGKPAKELTLGEAALLAGIIQGNVLQSPYRNMPGAKARQAYTLRRMVEEKYITQAQADEAKAQPLVLRGYAGPTSIAPYFTEMVRQQIQEKYGAKAVYEGGLTVQTAIDGPLQLAANAALDRGLRRLDKLRGYRKPTRNLVAEKHDVDKFRLASWTHEPAIGDILTGVVLGTDGGIIRVKFGRWAGTIDKAGYAWTKKTPAQVDLLVRRGDVVDVRVKALDAAGAAFTAELDQPPVLEGAMLALDNKTGEILAMVGGSSYERS